MKYKKRKERLEARQKDYDAMIIKPGFNARGVKRPGSLNH